MSGLPETKAGGFFNYRELKKKKKTNVEESCNQ
jgi:hypothetical protein